MKKYVDHILSLKKDIEKLSPYLTPGFSCTEKSRDSSSLLSKYAKLIRMRYILSRSWPDLCVPLSLDDEQDSEASFDDVSSDVTSCKDKQPLRLQRSLTYDSTDAMYLFDRPRSFSEAYTHDLYYVETPDKQRENESQKLKLKNQRRRKVADIGRQRAVTFSVDQEGRGCVQRTPTPFPRDVSVESEPDLQRSTGSVRDRLRFRRGKMSIVRSSHAFNESHECLLVPSGKEVGLQKVNSAPASPVQGHHEDLKKAK